MSSSPTLRSTAFSYTLQARFRFVGSDEGGFGGKSVSSVSLIFSPTSAVFASAYFFAFISPSNAATSISVLPGPRPSFELEIV